MRGLSFGERVSLAWKALVSPFSDQGAQAARGLLGGIFPASTGPVPDRHALQLLNTVNTSPWIRACAGKVADCMAGVTWKLSIVKGKGDARARSGIEYIQKAGADERRHIMKALRNEGELVDIPDHIMLTALRKGNGLLTGADIRWLASIYYDMVGEVFLIKERNSLGAPLAFWPIPSHWIAETPTPKRPRYRIDWNGWHADVPDKEMLWIKNPNPVNPYDRGVGLAKSLDDEVATDEYAAKHTLKYFKNSARPDLLIMPKDGQLFGDAENQRFEQWWNERVQGFWRSFKPLFLKSPVEVKVLEQNFKNMQMAELRQKERDTILQVWGLPPEMFGIVSNSNRSTIEVAPFIFAKYCLEPRLERYRSFFQERLVPEYDERLIIDYVSPVPHDKMFQLEVIKAQPNAFELNEIRELAGFEPEEELDDQYGSRGGVGAGTPDAQGGDGAESDPNLDALDDQEEASLLSLLVKRRGVFGRRA